MDWLDLFQEYIREKLLQLVVAIIAKRPEELAKGMVYAAMVETYPSCSACFIPYANALYYKEWHSGRVEK